MTSLNIIVQDAIYSGSVLSDQIIKKINDILEWEDEKLFPQRKATSAQDPSDEVCISHADLIITLALADPSRHHQIYSLMSNKAPKLATSLIKYLSDTLRTQQLRHQQKIDNNSGNSLAALGDDMDTVFYPSNTFDKVLDVASVSLGVIGSNNGRKGLKGGDVSPLLATAAAFKKHPRMLVAQALLILSRRYQLSESNLSAILLLLEGHILGHLKVVLSHGNLPINVRNQLEQLTSFGMRSIGVGRGNSDIRNNEGIYSSLNQNSSQHIMGDSRIPSIFQAAFYLKLSQQLTFLVTLCFLNSINVWSNIASPKGPRELNTFIESEAVEKKLISWMSGLKTRIVEAVRPSAIGSAYSSSTAASMITMRSVDGYWSIIELGIGMVCGAQDNPLGLDLVVSAFRGGRKDLNVPEKHYSSRPGKPLHGAQKEGGSLRETMFDDGSKSNAALSHNNRVVDKVGELDDSLSPMMFQGKVCKRLVQLCPDLHADLSLPPWVIPEIYFDLSNYLTGEDLLPALKRVANLDRSSYEYFLAAQDQALAARQERLGQQNERAFKYEQYPQPNEYIERNSGQLLISVAYPFTSAMSHFCDLLSFIFSVLPSRYLRVSFRTKCQVYSYGRATDTLSQSDEEALYEDDTGVATFIFRNMLFHLQEIFSDCHSSTASTFQLRTHRDAASNNNISSWDVFLTKLVASYFKLLSVISQAEESLAARVFLTLLGEMQSECPEILWEHLRNQLRHAIFRPASTSTDDWLLAEYNQRMLSFTHRVGGRGGGLGAGRQLGLQSLLRGTSASRAALGPDHSSMIFQTTSSYRHKWEQRLASYAMNLISNIATTAPKCPLENYFSLQDLVDFLNAEKLTPQFLGAILSAISTLITSREEQQYVWCALERKGLLAVGSETSTTSTQVPVNAPRGAASLDDHYANVRPLTEHCLHEAIGGRYDITIGFLRFMICVTKLCTETISFKSESAMDGAVRQSGNQGSLFGSNVIASNEMATTGFMNNPQQNGNLAVTSFDILSSQTYYNLTRFISDEIFCGFHQRPYANGDDMFILGALLCNYLNGALLACGVIRNETQVRKSSLKNVDSDMSKVSRSIPKMDNLPFDGSSSVNTPTVISQSICPKGPELDFKIIMATSRAPCDGLEAVLSLIRDITFSMTQKEWSLATIASPACTKVVPLRLALELLHTSLSVVKSDTDLSNSLFAFTTRTFENIEFVLMILELASSFSDTIIVCRCISLLNLIDSNNACLAARRLQSINSTAVDHIAFCLSSYFSDATEAMCGAQRVYQRSRFVLRHGMEALQSLDSPFSDDDDLHDASDMVLYGIPKFIANLGKDPLRNVDVPSVAHCLIDLLLKNVNRSSTSLTSWLCGYVNLGATMRGVGSGGSETDEVNYLIEKPTKELPTESDMYPGFRAEWANFALHHILVKINDLSFCCSPPTAQLATKYIRLIHKLMLNDSTATKGLRKLLTARNHTKFMKMVPVLSYIGISSDKLLNVTHDKLSRQQPADTSITESQKSYYLHRGITSTDHCSTISSSTMIFMIDFAGTAMQIAALHIRKLLLLEEPKQTLSSAHFNITRDEETSSLMDGRSAATPLFGDETSILQRGHLHASILVTSYDPLVIAVRKLLRIPSTIERNMGMTAGDGEDEEDGDTEYSVFEEAWRALAGDDDVVNSLAQSSAITPFSGDAREGKSSFSAVPTASTAYTATFGQRLQSVLELLPSYPSFSPPPPAPGLPEMDSFVYHNSDRVPQYNILAIDKMLLFSNPQLTINELAERLRVYVYANSCLMGYAAATNYTKGCAQIIGIVCSTTFPGGVRHKPEISDSQLVVLAQELCSALAPTSRYTVSTQEAIVTHITASITTVILKLSDQLSRDGSFWAEALYFSVNELLSSVFSALTRFGVTSRSARLQLYNAVRVITTLPGLKMDYDVLTAYQGPLFEMIVADIATGGSATVGVRDTPFSSGVDTNRSVELTALQCLRRIFVSVEMVLVFATSRRAAVSNAVQRHKERNKTKDNTLTKGLILDEERICRTVAMLASKSITNPSSLPEEVAPTHPLTSPSSQLITLCRSLFDVMSHSILSIFCAGRSDGTKIISDASFAYFYIEAASDILAMLSSKCPTLVFLANVTTNLLSQPCWKAVECAINGSIQEAIIVAQTAMPNYSDGGFLGISPQGGTLLGGAVTTDHFTHLLMKLSLKLTNCTFRWLNALLRDPVLQENEHCMDTVANFVQRYPDMFKSAIGGGVPVFGLGEPTCVIPNAAVEVTDKVSFFLLNLSRSHYSKDCCDLIPLFSLTDVLLALTNREAFNVAVFVPDDQQAPGTNLSPMSANLSQVQLMASTTRNIALFLVNALLPSSKDQDDISAQVKVSVPPIGDISTALETHLNGRTVDEIKEAREKRFASHNLKLLLDPNFLEFLQKAIRQISCLVVEAVFEENRSRPSTSSAQSSPVRVIQEKLPHLYLQALHSLGSLAHFAAVRLSILKKSRVSHPLLVANVSGTYDGSRQTAGLYNTLVSVIGYLSSVIGINMGSSDQSHHVTGINIEQVNSLSIMKKLRPSPVVTSPLPGGVNFTPRNGTKGSTVTPSGGNTMSQVHPNHSKRLLADYIDQCGVGERASAIRGYDTEDISHAYNHGGQGGSLVISPNTGGAAHDTRSSIILNNPSYSDAGAAMRSVSYEGMPQRKFPVLPVSIDQYMHLQRVRNAFLQAASAAAILQ